MNEFEAHEGSYDHQHRKRLKEMRNLTKDPSAAARQRAAEERVNSESGLKSISVPLSGSGGGAGSTGLKKKPVFKSTLQPQNASIVTSRPLDMSLGGDLDLNRAVANGWKDQAYDPAHPTEYIDSRTFEDELSRKYS